jgi:hypothetical protein
LLTGARQQHKYTQKQLMEHYWFTHYVDIAVPARCRPGVRKGDKGGEGASAPPLVAGDERVRDNRFDEYTVDMRRELVRLAIATPGHCAFVGALLEYCVLLRLKYAASKYWELAGLKDVVELVSEDVVVVHRAIKTFGAARQLLRDGRTREWEQSKEKMRRDGIAALSRSLQEPPLVSDDDDDRLNFIVRHLLWLSETDQIEDYRVFHPVWEP